MARRSHVAGIKKSIRSTNAAINRETKKLEKVKEKEKLHRELEAKKKHLHSLKNKKRR